MSKNKKIALSILTALLIITSLVFLKLAFGHINSPYLKEKISSHVFDISGKNIEINEVRLRLIKGVGLALDIPSAEIYINDKISIKDTIIDINIFSIILNGVSSSEFKISSKIKLREDQLFEIEIVSKNKNIIIQKLSNDDFSLNKEVHLKNNNLQAINISSTFSKSFIDQNFNYQLKKIYDSYGFNLSDLFFEADTYYDAVIKIDLKKQEIFIDKLENKHSINVKLKTNYSSIDKKINFRSIIPNINLIKILNMISSKRNTNNKKILKVFSELLYKEQVIEASLSIDKNLRPKDIEIIASGKINFNYLFDDNKDPSFLKGNAPYKIILYKKNILDNLYKLSSTIDLDDTNLYIRQINLQKEINEDFKLNIDSLFDLNKDIRLDIGSKSGDRLSLKGNIILSELNELLFNDIYIFNNDNVDLKISGDLINRNLRAKIYGNFIDLSKNLLKIDDRLKDYYFHSENYEILSKVAYLNGGVTVDDFKININKKENEIKIQSSGLTKDTNFDYTREKNTESDNSIVTSENIINTVGLNHASRNIIKNGKATVSSHRIIGSLKTIVEIDLENFVLINSPATLKLLSLPSFSGLSSAINNEAGIEFAYGKLNYKVDAGSYSQINAFAVNDGIGLVLEGDIDRRNKTLNLKGQVSPLHLISGIIQKIPIFGKILIGNEGEGFLAIEYSMSGDLGDPIVSSNPLSIFKPRLFERTLKFLNSGT